MTPLACYLVSFEMQNTCKKSRDEINREIGEWNTSWSLGPGISSKIFKREVICIPNLLIHRPRNICMDYFTLKPLNPFLLFFLRLPQLSNFVLFLIFYFLLSLQVNRYNFYLTKFSNLLSLEFKILTFFHSKLLLFFSNLFRN